MKTTELEQDQIRHAVRERYGQIARDSGGGCVPSCCGGSAKEGANPSREAAAISQRLGYTGTDCQAVPEGANLGLGCGNPVAIASLKPGETVLDLGSGAGFDAFLAAKAVGSAGRVIGVDMTADMVAKARANKAKGDYANVEFRLGEIESLPVADASVDVILSNCVINLSPDKPRVFREAFRVLRPGGRLSISDVLALAPIPEPLRGDLAAYANCVTGASLRAEVESMLSQAGFSCIRVEPREASRKVIRDLLPDQGAEDYVASATIEAVKPAVRR